MLQPQIWIVVTDTICPAKLKIFHVWSFTAFFVWVRRIPHCHFCPSRVSDAKHLQLQFYNIMFSDRIQSLFDDAPFFNLDLMPQNKSRDEQPSRKRRIDTNTTWNHHFVFFVAWSNLSPTLQKHRTYPCPFWGCGTDSSRTVMKRERETLTTCT